MLKWESLHKCWFWNWFLKALASSSQLCTVKYNTELIITLSTLKSWPIAKWKFIDALGVFTIWTYCILILILVLQGFRIPCNPEYHNYNFIKRKKVNIGIMAGSSYRMLWIAEWWVPGGKCLFLKMNINILGNKYLEQ